MPTSPKIYGKALYLTVNGVDYAADMQSATLAFEEADTDNLTFGDVAAGVGDKGKLSIKAIQSTESGSFWNIVWANAGQRVPFKLAPHGNETPSAAQPHITGTVFIDLRPDIGGEVDPKKAYTFEVEWEADVDKALKTSAEQ